MKGGFTDDFEYSEQIDWEEEAMDKVDIIMFWIPRELKNMPAFITNIEFGYWLAKDPSKIMLGIPHYAEKMNYIIYRANKNKIEI